VLWAGLLVMWPVASNRSSTGRRDTKAHGEGLYKKSLTQANFGLTGVRFFQSEGGKPRWAVRSEFAELHRSENLAYLDKVDAEFTADRTRNVVKTWSRKGK